MKCPFDEPHSPGWVVTFNSASKNKPMKYSNSLLWFLNQHMDLHVRIFWLWSCMMIFVFQALSFMMNLIYPSCFNLVLISNHFICHGDLSRQSVGQVLVMHEWNILVTGGFHSQMVNNGESITIIMWSIKAQVWCFPAGCRWLSCMGLGLLNTAWGGSNLMLKHFKCSV